MDKNINLTFVNLTQFHAAGPLATLLPGFGFGVGGRDMPMVGGPGGGGGGVVGFGRGRPRYHVYREGPLRQGQLFFQMITPPHCSVTEPDIFQDDTPQPQCAGAGYFSRCFPQPQCAGAGYLSRLFPQLQCAGAGYFSR